MAILTLFSVAGAPGTTTTALALALAWPRDVLLVDADPTASAPILAGYLRGFTPHDKSVVDLAIAQRHGELADTLPAVTLPIPDSRVQLLPGIQTPGQAAAVEGLWPDLLPILAGLDAGGTDVIIDAGRLGANHAPTAAIRAADLSLLVTRSTLPAIIAARAWLPTIETIVADQTGFGLAIVGVGHPHTAGEITGVLKTPILATLAMDPVTAEVFSLGLDPTRHFNPKHFNNSALVRSVRAAAGSLQPTAKARRDHLNAAIEEEPER